MIRAIPPKADLLRLAIQCTGLPWMRWALRRPGLYCFNFHRIGDRQSTEYDRGVFSCTRPEFESIILFLRKQFDIISLSRLEDGRTVTDNKRYALITFDDGYRDNFDVAASFLRSNEVPAVFFLPSRFIGSKCIPWWDAIAWSIRNRKTQQVDLSFLGLGIVDNNIDPDALIRTVLKASKASGINLQECTDRIAEECGVSSRREDGSLFMSWEDANKLVEWDFAVGSHTHSHPILSQLSREEKRKELCISKEILEARLNTKVIAVAYPVGGRSAFTDVGCEEAQRAGYSLGFTFCPGVAALPLRDKFRVPRFGVDDDPTPGKLKYDVSMLGATTS